MLFNSVDFVIFLFVVLGLVHGAGIRLRNWLLLAASLVFFAWWDYRYLTLLGVNCLTAYYGGIAIEGLRDDPAKKKRLCTWLVVFFVGILCYFKYRGFFFENLTSVFALFHIGHDGKDLDAMLPWFGLTRENNLLKFTLPIGISFYTFQAIAYVVDVHRGTTPACRGLRDFLLFKTFFPQLVAGPIERANNLLPQITQARRVTSGDIIEGLYLILWGFTKKVVIADNIGLKIGRVFAQETYNTGDVLLAAIGFTFQVYGDFSGYTDIARGTARLFGVKLMQNFQFPYFATNPQDFWRRWHISLGSWLREYIYIPLGGNRCSTWRIYFNLYATMLIGGLWHGPSWNYIIWGFYQGTILSAHRLYSEWRGKTRHSHTSRVICIALNFILTAYGMLIFRLESWDKILAATGGFFGCVFSPDFAIRFVKMLPYIALILIMETPLFLAKHETFFTKNRHPLLIAAVYLFLFYCILILGVTGGDQFIYFQF